MCSYRGPLRAMRILEQKNIFGPMEEFMHKAWKKLYPKHNLPFSDIEISMNPPEFDEITRKFVDEILNVVYQKNEIEKQDEIRVIDQLFPVCNPENYLKYVENSAAIIVDRDPRDHYLFAKLFLAPKGRVVCPCDTVENYIQYFRTTHQTSPKSREDKNVAFFQFEELIYDCDNTAKKLADFVGAGNRVRSGECFKPAHSRNNSQLFKKYPEYASDIKKIEQALPEFLFPFEKYPDIEAEGQMFYGSQHKKRYK
jgi:hypothetical protein